MKIYKIRNKNKYFCSDNDFYNYHSNFIDENDITRHNIYTSIIECKNDYEHFLKLNKNLPQISDVEIVECEMKELKIIKL